MELFIGTSGFSYKHWGNGVFYPPRLPQSKYLSYYAGHFNTVELNVTFYRLPSPETFARWAAVTPPSFTFAIKGSRLITHVKRLADCKEPLKAFFEALLPLREKLKVILWQFPPGFHASQAKLTQFLCLLQEIAPHLKHAFEFRHISWFTPPIYSSLREFNAALCVPHSNRWPWVWEITADFGYLRFHGGETYASKYTEAELSIWAKRVGVSSSSFQTLFAYFNNDVGGHAVENARTFREILKQELFL